MIIDDAFESICDFFLTFYVINKVNFVFSDLSPFCSLAWLSELVEIVKMGQRGVGSVHFCKIEDEQNIGVGFFRIETIIYKKKNTYKYNRQLIEILMKRIVSPSFL